MHEQRQDMAVGGEQRWYLLTTPRDRSSAPRALVLDLHGLLEGATVHARMSSLAALADEQGFVAVMPNGTGSPVQWDTNPRAGANKDVAFIGRLLDRLEADLCIDTSRVYAAGLSDGAIVSSVLACTMADRFAAVGLVAGITMPEPCPGTRPVPVLAFHGTADPILLFNGGVGPALRGLLTGKGLPPTSAPAPVDLHGAGYPATVAAWARRDGCKPDPTDKRITAEVIHRSYDCPAGVAVEFFIIFGGGHAWPGSELSRSIVQFVGHTTFDVDATKEIWKFFQRYRLP